MNESATHDAIEAVARDSYGRLVAYIASRTGDIADVHDAMSEALVAALETWPRNGVPDKPEAWLLHVARNRLIDASRREQTRRDAGPLLLQLAGEAESSAKENEFFPDERLKLLFVCAQLTCSLARPRDSRVLLALSDSPPYPGHLNTPPISHAMEELKTTPAHFIELSTVAGRL